MTSLSVSCAFSANTIIIISHLRPGELRTHQSLFEDLNALSSAGQGLPVKLYELKGIAELRALLDRLPSWCKSLNLRPIIHFECHGDEEKGLVLRDGTVPWRRLGEALRTINYATQNNLVVTMATCFGIKAYFDAMRIRALCPAWYFVAPIQGAEVGDLATVYSRFYSSLQVCMDSNSAAEESHLDDVCLSVSSPAFFIELVLAFFSTQCRGKEKQRWVENVVTATKWLQGHPQIEELKRVRAQAKENIRPSEAYFHKWATSFLYSRERLGCSWEDIDSFLKKIGG